jgi:HAE1 family hydrophobic/amphiphilic exporter-1
MTTVSFVAGLLPLLIATGPGAEERRSIAVLVVGGQTLSLVLTLIAIPVLYTFIDDLTAMVWKGSEHGEEMADQWARSGAGESARTVHALAVDHRRRE